MSIGTRKNVNWKEIKKFMSGKNFIFQNIHDIDLNLCSKSHKDWVVQLLFISVYLIRISSILNVIYLG